MAVPVFKTAGTWAFTPTTVVTPATLAPGAPAGVVAGDLLILICEARSAAGTVATPSGWNLLTGFPSRSAGSPAAVVYVFTRVADGTAADTPSPVWSSLVTGTSGDSAGAGILRYANATEVSDGTLATSDLASQTTTSVIPAFTAGRGNTLVLGVAMKLVESSGQSATVATFTERADNSTTSGLGHEVEVSEHIQAGSGSSGTATVTWSATTSARAYMLSFGLQATPAVVAPAAINATGDVSATVTGLKRATPAAISSTGTVTAAVGRLRPVAPAAVNATSAVTGNVQALKRATPAAVNATSAVTVAVVKLAAVNPAAISSTSTVAGRVAALRPIVPGAISSTTSVTASVHALRAIAAGAMTATSSVSATVTKNGAPPIIPSAITSTSTVSGLVTLAASVIADTGCDITLEAGGLLVLETGDGALLLETCVPAASGSIPGIIVPRPRRREDDELAALATILAIRASQRRRRRLTVVR